MCRGRSSTVTAGCLGLFAACAVAPAQEQPETKRLDVDVTVQVESSDADNKGGPTRDDADAGTEPKVSEADRRRANELDRQAKRTVTRARELARQAKRMAEQARQLAQQAAELRGDDLSPDLGWGLFEKEDRQAPPTAQTQGQKQPLKLDDIIGMSVQNDRDEDLGAVEDVVLDSSSGQIRYVALSFGGWLGIDDKLFAVPWGAFRLTNGGDERVLVLNKTKKQLREAPGFDQDDWPHYADASLRGQIHEFYTSDETAGESRESRAFRAGAADREKPLKGSNVLGMTVKNTRGEELGTVSDVVVDHESGRIRYAALSFGGWLGIGDKLFAVPWDAMKTGLTKGDGQDPQLYLVLNKSREELKQAPGFPQDDWPATANASFRAEVDKFYGHESPKR